MFWLEIPDIDFWLSSQICNLSPVLKKYLSNQEETEFPFTWGFETWLLIYLILDRGFYPLLESEEELEDLISKLELLEIPFDQLEIRILTGRYFLPFPDRFQLLHPSSDQSSVLPSLHYNSKGIPGCFRESESVFHLSDEFGSITFDYNKFEIIYNSKYPYRVLDDYERLNLNKIGSLNKAYLLFMFLYHQFSNEHDLIVSEIHLFFQINLSPLVNLKGERIISRNDRFIYDPQIQREKKWTSPFESLCKKTHFDHYFPDLIPVRLSLLKSNSFFSLHLEHDKKEIYEACLLMDDPYRKWFCKHQLYKFMDCGHSSCFNHLTGELWNHLIEQELIVTPSPCLASLRKLDEKISQTKFEPFDFSHLAKSEGKRVNFSLPPESGGKKDDPFSCFNLDTN